MHDGYSLGVRVCCSGLYRPRVGTPEHEGEFIHLRSDQKTFKLSSSRLRWRLTAGHLFTQPLFQMPPHDQSVPAFHVRRCGPAIELRGPWSASLAVSQRSHRRDESTYASVLVDVEGLVGIIHFVNVSLVCIQVLELLCRDYGAKNTMQCRFGGTCKKVVFVRLSCDQNEIIWFKLYVNRIMKSSFEHFCMKDLLCIFNPTDETSLFIFDLNLFPISQNLTHTHTQQHTNRRHAQFIALCFWGHVHTHTDQKDDDLRTSVSVYFSCCPSR